MKVSISKQLECREQGTMQLILSGAWCSTIRKSVSMQMKLSPTALLLVFWIIYALFFLLISWMKPSDVLVVRKPVSRPAICIFSSCLGDTTMLVWKCLPISINIRCFPKAPIAMQMSSFLMFLSMISIIISIMSLSSPNLKWLLQQVLSKIISSMGIEMPLMDSTSSFLSIPSRFCLGNSTVFSLIISKLYLKSPVNNIVPMQPWKSIIAEPGMCLASKNQKSTKSPGLISRVFRLQRAHTCRFATFGYLWVINWLVTSVQQMGPQSHLADSPSQ